MRIKIYNNANNKKSLLLSHIHVRCDIFSKFRLKHKNFPYKLMRPYANPALYQMDVPALSYIYAAYGKSGLISNGKE
jgi:hypothetical protein